MLRTRLAIVAILVVTAMAGVTGFGFVPVSARAQTQIEAKAATVDTSLSSSRRDILSAGLTIFTACGLPTGAWAAKEDTSLKGTKVRGVNLGKKGIEEEGASATTRARVWFEHNSESLTSQTFKKTPG